MKTEVRLKKNMLVEYKGDFYTPEELAEELNATGKFDVVLHDDDETWFGVYMDNLKDKESN